jgi:protein SCO1/2
MRPLGESLMRGAQLAGALLVVAPIALAAATLAHRQSHAAVPFYDSADFTPRWSPTAARSADFTMISQRGATVTAGDLRGRIHVASFIFTRCSAICPSLVRQLKRVQSEDVQLVSYSVMPDVDTPAALAAFGAREGIDPARWLLLTGDRSAMVRLAREFYFADDHRLEPTTGDFVHTEKVLLVDAGGRLRGIYNGTVPFDIERLLADIRLLRAADPS